MKPYILIATWHTSMEAVKAAIPILEGGGDAADAAERCANIVENDPLNFTVGFNSFPNAKGEVELDAGFMDGDTYEIGGVAALRGYRNAASIARKVMTESPHNLLAARGAEDFAEAHGFTTSIMTCDNVRLEWEKRVAEGNLGITSHEKENRVELSNGAPDALDIGHDTVGVIALDQRGHIVACTSTGGVGMKARGRVGDSPMVGNGFYADSNVGAAVATGRGEDIMRCPTCFVGVELLREGWNVRDACVESVRRTHMRAVEHGRSPLLISLILVDKHGNYAAASNFNALADDSTFSYIVATHNEPPTEYPGINILKI